MEVQQFYPQVPTWELIVKNCLENEVEEVKRILGTSLVEQAIDLHEEVSSNCSGQIAKIIFLFSG